MHILCVFCSFSSVCRLLNTDSNDDCMIRHDPVSKTSDIFAIKSDASHLCFRKLRQAAKTSPEERKTFLVSKISANERL
uniref:Putative secreted protein n=1 Tax=Anopheles triannulatus TaxID=58253 RepID=A0A2M4B209_9DIPT